MPLTDAAIVTCPWCAESFEVPVDPAEGPRQEWQIDCEICCHPIRVRIRMGRRGPRAEAEREE